VIPTAIVTLRSYSPLSIEQPTAAFTSVICRLLTGVPINIVDMYRKKSMASKTSKQVSKHIGMYCFPSGSLLPDGIVKRSDY
jgi:hypothetical protein